MYLLDVEFGVIIVYLLIAAIALFIQFLIIRFAVASALKEQMRSFTAYKLLELKRQGISKADINNANKYLDLTDKIENDDDSVKAVNRKKLDDWWKDLHIGEHKTENSLL